MASPSIHFERTGGYWASERKSVGFSGETEFGPVEFLITSEALAYLVSPSLDAIDSETALEAFIEFEADIHCIARLEFVKRLGGEPPILLTAADTG